MKVKYFEDTDTALIEFTGKPACKTREVSEYIYIIYIDVDKNGNLISMTIERAKENANL